MEAEAPGDDGETVGLLTLPNELLAILCITDAETFSKMHCISRTLATRTHYDANLAKDGTWLTWNKFRGSSFFVKEEKFVGGRLEGRSRVWDTQGRLVTRINYKAGKRHGKFKEWWRNGRLRLRCSYKKGLRHGPLTQCFESGQMRLSFCYVDGYLDGEYKYWNKDGNLLEHKFYRDGTKYSEIHV